MSSFSPMMYDAPVDSDRLERARALRRDRLNDRRQRLTCGGEGMLDAEEAAPCDLNRLAVRAVSDAQPMLRALETLVEVDIDWAVPPVRVLSEPIADALAAAIDLAFDPDVIGEQPASVRVSTALHQCHAVVEIERRAAADTGTNLGWRDIETLPWVELMIGESTSRALGGRLRAMARGASLRVRLELPVRDKPWVPATHSTPTVTAPPMIYWARPSSNEVWV